MSPYLYTVILAISSRYILPTPTVDPSTSLQLRRLAYTYYVASQFRRHQSLPDVQATLLLAAYGMYKRNKGPDPWIVTGHCGRLTHRLGLQRLGKVRSVPEDVSGIKGSRLVAQWKTWLCWYW